MIQSDKGHIFVYKLSRESPTIKAERKKTERRHGKATRKENSALFYSALINLHTTTATIVNKLTPRRRKAANGLVTRVGNKYADRQQILIPVLQRNCVS